MDIHVYLHLPGSGDLHEIKAKLLQLTGKVDTMSGSIQAKLDALTQEVSELDTVKESVVAFINGVPAMIKTAVDAALAQGATPEQLAAFDALALRLDADSNALAAAITANTPSA